MAIHATWSVSPSQTYKKTAARIRGFKENFSPGGVLKNKHPRGVLDISMAVDFAIGCFVKVRLSALRVGVRVVTCRP